VLVGLKLIRRAGQGVGEGDRLVDLAEELAGRDDQLPEGARDGERRRLQLPAERLGRAQQRGKHPIGGELTLGAEPAQLAHANARLARQRLGEQRHGLQHGAQCVASGERPRFGAQSQEFL